ncbi:transposase family protein [Streptomyces javensis]|uniref:helix-turn-helix domain-containing protein n=1 Tax=Streptomyces javensis TaxID=114698 RepID=UPI0033DBD952
MTKKWARASLSYPAFIGVSRPHLGDLIEELTKPWGALREAALHARRGRKRLRAAEAGPKQELVLTDRVVLTLVQPRTHLPHAALAELYGVGRSTVSDAISEIRPLLARRGFAVPDRPGRMHDQTAMRTEGIAEQLRLHPGVKTEVDEGYWGLANEFPGQVTAPPKKQARRPREGEAGLVRDAAPPVLPSHRRPRRPTRPAHSTDLMLAHPAVC